MDFRSDNTASIHPLILDALIKANTGNQASYGNDDASKKLKQQLSELFDQEIWLALVSTGTAANCIGLRALTPGHGSILASHEAHLHNDEGQAPELLLGGAKIRTFSNQQHKLDLDAARTWIHKARTMKPHAGFPASLSITQSTEWGDVYSSQELRDIRQLCDLEKLALHIDGARLANALSAKNMTAREFIKIAKPDALSLGFTKNAGLIAEAVLVFSPEHAELLSYAQKQTGQLLSKTRFLATQFLALLKNDLWLTLAHEANQRAKELGEVLSQHQQIKLVSTPTTNQVFAHITREMAASLTQKGALFYPWESAIYRFVCSWMTQPSDINNFSKVLNSL